WSVYRRALQCNQMIKKLTVTGVIGACVCIYECSTPVVTKHVAGDSVACVDHSSLILWGTAWRSNQKEPERRRSIARQAITNFFTTNFAIAPDSILEQIQGRDPVALSDTEILNFAQTSTHKWRQIVLIRVEELGPLIVIYPSPILWEGGTETRMRIRVLDIAPPALKTDVSLHRRDTGAFVLRGTGSLNHDLEFTLKEVFGEKCESRQIR
ncbi:MAG TPA: hypothetical protein PKC35_20315, partial [Leptospiraceae bacterium]|nr:hypothetical protein [Leptospiraceae bacterium]